MLQAHGKAEGQELSGLSTSEHSQAHWDHQLMQSLSSASSATDPLLYATLNSSSLFPSLSLSYPFHKPLSLPPTLVFFLFFFP